MHPQLILRTGPERVVCNPIYMPTPCVGLREKEQPPAGQRGEEGVRGVESERGADVTEHEPPAAARPTEEHGPEGPRAQPGTKASQAS